MRSENTRKPERMSHGKVARKRYRRIGQRDDALDEGQGYITGHQKRNPAPKNDACSNACSALECNAAVNTDGMCHATSVKAETVQHNVSRESACASRCIQRDWNSRPSASRATRGKPCHTASTGSPNRISAGANVISRRCWIMWAVSKS